jgi:protein-S-isoprenylcysteine O-methyltransferase Ste14
VSVAAPLACAALLVLILAIGLWCQVRVTREYVGEGLLSIPTVWLVWILYALQIGLVAIPALDAWGPVPGPPLLWRALGSSLVALGLALAAWGVASFHSLRRMNGRDTSALVTGGAYRYSRNPQNAGIGIALVGGALLGPSSVALAAAALFWLMFRAYVPTEERFLEATYGERYRRYRAHSHRFIGLPRERDAAA